MISREMLELNQMRLHYQSAAILLDLMVHSHTTRDELAKCLSKDRKHVDKLLAGNWTLDAIGDAYLVFNKAVHIRLVATDPEPQEQKE